MRKKELRYIVFGVDGNVRKSNVRHLYATSSNQKVFVFNDADITTESTAYRSYARIKRADSFNVGPITLLASEITVENTGYTQDELNKFLESINVDYTSCRILILEKQALAVSGPISITVVYDRVNELGRTIETQAKAEVSAYVYDAVEEILTEEEYISIKEEMLPRDLGDITVSEEFKDTDHLVIAQNGATKKITGKKLKEEVIKNVVNDTLLEEQIETEVYESLTKKEQEYAPRLTNLEKNKADISYVEQLSQSLASGSPKGTYDNIMELQADIPEGNNNIYITTDDGQWNYWNGTMWVAGGTYQSAGISDNSITPNKTTFFNFKLGKNLFNKETRTVNSAVSPTTGSLGTHTSVDTSDFIEVEGNENYYISHSNRVAWYDANKVFISGLYDGTTFALTSPANAKYIRVSMLKTVVDIFQIEKGTVGTSYEPYSVTPVLDSTYFEKQYLDKVPENSIGVEHFVNSLKNNFIRTKNLFNKETRELDKLVVHSTGALQSDVRFDTSDFIEVEPNTEYHKTVFQRHAWYDVNKIYISGSYNEDLVVLSPPNAKYIRVTIPKEDVDTFQFEKGNKATEYEPYGYKLNIPNVGDLETLEQYLIDEINEIEEKVVAINSSLNFTFATDIHNNIWNNQPHKFQVLGEIGKRGIVDFVGIGGDIVDEGQPVSELKKRLLKLVNYARDSYLTFICRGNHDTGFTNYTTGDVIKPHEWYNIACRHLEEKVVFDEQNPQGGYYYKDFNNAKIRVIVLNTSDFYIEGDNSINPLTCRIRQQQFSWFQNKALNFMDKGTDRSNWGVVILSHASINVVESSELNGKILICEVLKAFMTGTTYSANDNVGTAIELNANVDFTTQGPMELICSINGHRHWDRVTTLTAEFASLNRPCIAVANHSGNVDYKVDPLPAGATVPTDRTKGTINNELFDIFSIDRQARKIYTTRFGAGNDRVIDY